MPSVNNYIMAKENANKYPQQIKCFETHPSITTMTKQCQSFNFQKTNANEVMKIIKMQILLLKSLNLRNIFLQNLSVITSTTVLMKMSFHMN